LLVLARKKTNTDESKEVNHTLMGYRVSAFENNRASSGDAMAVPDAPMSPAKLGHNDDSKSEYIFSRRQLFTYTQVFRNFSERSQTAWGVETKVKTMDAQHLRQALLDCGYFRTDQGINRLKNKLGLGTTKLLSLEQFLGFMKRVSMSNIPILVRKEYETTYNRYATDPDGGLHIDELQQMMSAVCQESYSLADLDGVINQWGDKQKRTVNFVQFLSMMAFSSKQNRLERHVERTAFRLFSRGGRRIYWNDIQEAIENMTGKHISDREAKAMLWEADVNKRDYLDKHDFLQLVMTVYKPGYVVLWNYEKHKSEEVQLDMLEEKDLAKFDQEIKQWQEQVLESDEDDDDADDDSSSDGEIKENSKLVDIYESVEARSPTSQEAPKLRKLSPGNKYLGQRTGSQETPRKQLQSPDADANYDNLEKGEGN